MSNAPSASAPTAYPNLYNGSPYQMPTPGYGPTAGMPPGYGQYGQPLPQGYQMPQYPMPPPMQGPYQQPPMGPMQYGPSPSQPIATQPPGSGPYAPNTGNWVSPPTSAMNCPRGLEYLHHIDQLLIQQKVELLEALVGFETKNKFTIKNSVGQKVYYAVEDTDCLTRNCCGPMRPFNMKILDNYNNEVIHLYRPLACDSCFFPCCLQSMEVSSPPGNVIGSIVQEWSILSPSFAVKNASNDIVLRIEGPICTTSLCGDVDFKVLSADGRSQVGKISKQWSGLLREMFTDADYFGLTFPLDLDIRMKAVMLGACFLIDAMFFEKHRNQETDRPGMF